MAYVAWVTAIGILLAYEFYALKKKKTTLSRAVWTLTQRWPAFSAIVGFALGILFGHFFWISCGPCQ